MKDRDIRRFERIERVKSFLDEHIDDFAPSGIVATTLDEITEIIGELKLARVGQIRTPLTKDEIIGALEESFKAISRTSRSIHKKHPSFPAEDFRFPEGDSESATTTHADHLLTLLQDDPAADTPEKLASKAALRDLFFQFEMSPDFVTRLQTLRTSLDDANSGKFNDNRDGIEATAKIATCLKKANDAVITVNGPIHNRYSNDPDKIHAWKRISRIASNPSPASSPAAPLPPTS